MTNGLYTREAVNVTIAFILFLAGLKINASDSEIPSRLLHISPYQVQQSIIVRRIADGEVLYSHHPDTLLIPASLTKLVTTAVILDKWGPVHKFTTRTFHTGKRTGDVINGDLVIIGGGDPYLVSEKMWMFASRIKNLGVNTITGQVIIDTSLFAPEVTRSNHTSTNAYDAPVTAFGINFNTVSVLVIPATAVGRKATVTLFPFPLKAVQIDNQVTTVAAHKSSAVTTVRTNTNKRFAFKIKVTGQIAISHKPITIYRSISNPLKIAREYVRNFLRQHDVQVLGKRQSFPKRTLTPLHDIKSYPISYIVKGLNTFSNNYIADVLLKKLGADHASRKSGVEHLTSWLRDIANIKSKFVLQNGSGLSSENRLSARQLAIVLQHVAQRMDLFPDFIASLPASGLEGTVTSRLRAHKGSIRAKTGTLTSPVSVSGLGGYYYSSEHGLISFVMIANGRAGHSQPPIPVLRRQQDNILSWLIAGKKIH